METKLTLEEAKRRHREYLDNFDPSPLHYGDDYLYPMDLDDFMDYESIEVI